MLSPKTVLYSLYKAADNTVQHDGIEHAGYLAFLGLLALFPFLVFMVALTGFIGAGDAGKEFVSLLFSHLPRNMVEALEPRIAEIISGPPQGLLTVSIFGAIWTASSELEGYRTILNRAYHVHTPPSYIFRRLLSIAQTFILSFILVVMMLVIILIPIIWDYILAIFGKHFHFDADSVNHIALVSVGIIFIVVSAAYYFLPNIKQNLHSVVPGAAIVTMLWMLSARLLSFYFKQFSQLSIVYGSLAGVIAALLFFYVNNVIFIFGAEFNYLIKVALGEKIEQRIAAESATEGKS